MIKDRLTRGFLSGVVAGALMNLWSYLSHAFGMADLRFVDWASIMVFGHKSVSTFLTHMLALVSDLIFTGLLGIIFAYLIPAISSDNLFFKGWLFGVSVWFSIYALSVLLKLPELAVVDFGTAVSNFIGANIFGLVLAASLKWLETKSET